MSLNRLAITELHQLAFDRVDLGLKTERDDDAKQEQKLKA